MRTKKALRNALFSIIYQIVSIICGLITPRLILSAFGSTYNGVISSANQFLEMISFLTLGIAGATRVALYKPLANGDKLAISRIVKANKRYMHKVGIAIILYSIVLSLIYPYISHNDLPHVESASLIAIVAIGVFAQYFFGVTNQTLLSADQSSYINFTISSLSIIANTLLSVILIKLGFSIFIVKLGSSIVFLISPIIMNYIVIKRYQITNDCEPDNTALSQRGAVAFHSIANIIHEDTDLIVLTLFTDAKLISVYTVYLLVVGKVRKILLMLTNGLEGAFGNMWAKGELKAFEINYYFYEYITYAFTSVIFSCVFVLIIPFIELYTRGITDINYIRTEFAILIVITETIYCVRHPYLIIVQATGNYEKTKIGALLEAIINIIISLVLVQFLDINGVMIGTLIANTFRTVQYAYFISKNLVKNSIKKSIFLFIWLGINSAIIIVTSSAFSFIVSSLEWKNWILYGCLVFFIACIVTVITSLVFYKTDLMRFIQIIGSVIKREKGANV